MGGGSPTWSATRIALGVGEALDVTRPSSVRRRVITVLRLSTAYVLPPKFLVSGMSMAMASML